VIAAYRLNRPVPEVLAMHPRDLSTMLDLYEEDQAALKRIN
jgi:hypothetical protein